MTVENLKENISQCIELLDKFKVNFYDYFFFNKHLSALDALGNINEIDNILKSINEKLQQL